MGTTKDAVLAGSTNFRWVVAIEGYDRLLTSHEDLAAVVTAWAGSDWTSASGGLFVELSEQQAASPDEPFGKMGSCNLWITPTPGDDLIGVALARKTSPYESYLDATLDNDDTTVTVKSAANAASSGFVHIGTECIAYTGKTATTLTGCTRGKFSPFGKFADYLAAYASGRSFSHYHRVGQDQNSVNLQPRVTSLPRQWNGRLVAVYMHQLAGGVLDTRAQAELVFAGKILDTRDDGNTGAAVIQVKGILEVFGEATIGGSQWKGTAEEGVFLAVGDVFEFADTVQTGAFGTTSKNANQLLVVAGTPASANEIQTGAYTLTNLCSPLSAWLASETAAGRLSGTYSVGSPVSIPGGQLRTKVYWSLGTTVQSVSWQFGMPPGVATCFGFQDTIVSAASAVQVIGNVAVQKSGPGASSQHYYQSYPPQKTALPVNGGPSARIVVSTTSGTAYDQYFSLPGSIRPFVSVGLSWGVFLFGDSRLVVAALTDNGDGTVLLQFIQPAFYDPNPSSPAHDPIVIGDNEELTVTQIYAFESDPATIVASLAIGTGTVGYNTPYVDLPPGCGASLPYELIAGLVLSMTGIQSFATSTLDVLIEKPIKISELLGSDFGVRLAFMRWHGGSLEAGAWVVPTVDLAIATLDETNKAEPAGNKTSQRTTSAETTEWLRQIVKIRYNRDATDPKGDSYRSTLEFVDAASVDDAGGGGATITLSLRNTYSEFAASGQSITTLLSHFMAMLPLFSRAAIKPTRSLSSRLFMAIGVGDVVLVSDGFARDPETGLRGLVERPAMVVRLRRNYGGLTPGADKPTAAGGDVDILFTDVNPDRVGAGYVPSAELDDQYTSGAFVSGYDSTNHVLKVLTNRFSEPTEVVDAGAFQAGDGILIVERDPPDPDNPTKWSRTVASVLGDTITLTAALASPAFDATKRYHVLFDDYASATATQHGKTYQADDATGLVVSTAQPYLYGSSSADVTYTTNAQMAARYPASRPLDVEMIPSSRATDGAGRDVAHESALANLLNNLIDRKTAVQSPMLSNVVISNTTHSGYLLVAYWPIYLTTELLSNAVFRYITCAPWAYSTDGTSTKIRVTLSLDRPSFPTVYDVPWAGTRDEVEWTGITSTTPGTLADQVLTANVKHAITGEAWLSVELGLKCATRLLAKFVEGVRQAI